MTQQLYKDIFELAKPLLIKGRWYDLWHTEMSIKFMGQILKREKRENLAAVLIPTIILHDIGWSTIGKDKNTDWGNNDMRIIHMRKGANIAKKLLESLDYDKSLTLKIVKLVSTHDNVYLGINPQTIEERLVRDADSCFVLTGLSFWKDYYVSGKDMTPFEFLNSQVSKYGKRFTKTAQSITNKQILRRKGEIKNNKISPNQRFYRYKKLAEERNKRFLVT